jgi:hypothetical protein
MRELHLFSVLLRLVEAQCTAGLLYVGIHNLWGHIPTPYTQRFTSDIDMSTMTVRLGIA